MLLTLLCSGHLSSLSRGEPNRPSHPTEGGGGGGGYKRGVGGKGSAKVVNTLWKTIRQPENVKGYGH